MDSVEDRESVVISTQVAWHETEDEAEIGAANKQDEKAGRFDLVLTHTRDQFVIVVESKRQATIEQEQVRKYRKELSRSIRFSGISRERRYLVGLTNWPRKIDELDGRMSWSTLVDNVLDEPDDLRDDYRLVLRQFKDFLNEKGLGPMKLEKVVGNDLLGAWRRVRTIQDQLEKILMAVRAHEELQGKVKFKPRAEFEGSDWYGVDNSGPYIYIGFRFLGDPPNAKMFLFIERSLPGDHLTRSLSENLRAAATEARELGQNWPEFSEGETFFAFAKEVDDQLDGNPEAIVRWFVDTCKEVLALGE